MRCRIPLIWSAWTRCSTAKRVGFMALQCGRALGLDEPVLEDLFHAGLLHDCAVSSTILYRQLINELDWEGAEVHCVRGGELLASFAPLAHLAPVIHHHHIHWEAFSALEVPEATARLANLIYLTDRVDALAIPHYERDLLLARHAIRDTIWRLSGPFSRRTRRRCSWICPPAKRSGSVWGAPSDPVHLRAGREARLVLVSFPSCGSSRYCSPGWWTPRAHIPWNIPGYGATGALAAERSGLPAETEKIEIASCCTIWASCRCRTRFWKTRPADRRRARHNSSATVSRPTRFCAASAVWRTSPSGPPPSRRRPMVVAIRSIAVARS